jgi:hypothetical protein
MNDNHLGQTRQTADPRWHPAAGEDPLPQLSSDRSIHNYWWLSVDVRSLGMRTGATFKPAPAVTTHLDGETHSTLLVTLSIDRGCALTIATRVWGLCTTDSRRALMLDRQDKNALTPLTLHHRTSQGTICVPRCFFLSARFKKTSGLSPSRTPSISIKDCSNAAARRSERSWAALQCIGSQVGSG